MVDKSIILKKISHIRNNLSRLKNKKGISLESFKNDIDAQDIILHNLQLVIQGCIDIGSHIIADEGWGIASSIGEIFYILNDRSVLKIDITERMVLMVGFRNILIHEYEEVNLDIVHNILVSHLDDIDEYLMAIVNYFNLG